MSNKPISNLSSASSSRRTPSAQPSDSGSKSNLLHKDISLFFQDPDSRVSYKKTIAVQEIPTESKPPRQHLLQQQQHFPSYSIPAPLVARSLSSSVLQKTTETLSAFEFRPNEGLEPPTKPKIRINNKPALSTTKSITTSAETITLKRPDQDLDVLIGLTKSPSAAIALGSTVKSGIKTGAGNIKAKFVLPKFIAPTVGLPDSVQSAPVSVAHKKNPASGVVDFGGGSGDTVSAAPATTDASLFAQGGVPSSLSPPIFSFKAVQKSVVPSKNVPASGSSKAKFACWPHHLHPNAFPTVPPTSFMPKSRENPATIVSNVSAVPNRVPQAVDIVLKTFPQPPLAQLKDGRPNTLGYRAWIDVLNLYRPQYNALAIRKHAAWFREKHELPTILLKSLDTPYEHSTIAIPESLVGKFVEFLDDLFDFGGEDGVVSGMVSTSQKSSSKGLKSSAVMSESLFNDGVESSTTHIPVSRSSSSLKSLTATVSTPLEASVHAALQKTAFSPSVDALAAVAPNAATPQPFGSGTAAVNTFKSSAPGIRDDLFPSISASSQSFSHHDSTSTLTTSAPHSISTTDTLYPFLSDGITCDFKDRVGSNAGSVSVPQPPKVMDQHFLDDLFGNSDADDRIGLVPMIPPSSSTPQLPLLLPAEKTRVSSIKMSSKVATFPRIPLKSVAVIPRSVAVTTSASSKTTAPPSNQVQSFHSDTSVALSQSTDACNVVQEVPPVALESKINSKIAAEEAGTPWPDILRAKYPSYILTKKIPSKVHAFLTGNNLSKTLKMTKDGKFSRCIPDSFKTRFFEYMEKYCSLELLSRSGGDGGGASQVVVDSGGEDGSGSDSGSSRAGSGFNVPILKRKIDAVDGGSSIGSREVEVVPRVKRMKADSVFLNDTPARSTRVKGSESIVPAFKTPAKITASIDDSLEISSSTPDIGLKIAQTPKLKRKRHSAAEPVTRNKKQQQARIDERVSKFDFNELVEYSCLQLELMKPEFENLDGEIVSPEGYRLFRYEKIAQEVLPNFLTLPSATRVSIESNVASYLKEKMRGWFAECEISNDAGPGKLYGVPEHLVEDFRDWICVELMRV
ncbi:UNVERIFIED_CONTAM: hypothetical protein HDU68_008643 [Siphonaria sp. JEL0065]|nr:hypothetical protein HDU68_008643 [Siphonaria sp. JEL0065]